jgi:hypothetical protein
MPSKILCLLWLAATLNVTGAVAQDDVVPTPTPTPGAAPTAAPTATATTTPAPGGIRISITNVYEVALDFGPLGNGSRDGTDKAEGVLKRQGRDYVGIVEANVVSNQAMHGLIGGCGPADYKDSQKLRVIGHPVSGFNQLVQSVDPATMGQASNEYLSLEFAPETMTSQQPKLRLPPKMAKAEDEEGDLVVSCHTLIDTLSGIAFLPLNDSRWTMDGGGYIIVLPTSGVLNYTDDTLAVKPNALPLPTVPFNAKKSLWTIQVERLP